MIARLLLAAIFLVGLTGMVGCRNIIKKIFGLTIMNNAAVVFFVLGGAEIGRSAPILAEGIGDIVDPVPQALMLTAIVIGVCISALALALAFRLYRATGTFNIDAIYEILNNSEDSNA